MSVGTDWSMALVWFRGSGASSRPRLVGAETKTTCVLILPSVLMEPQRHHARLSPRSLAREHETNSFKLFQINWLKTVQEQIGKKRTKITQILPQFIIYKRGKREVQWRLSEGRDLITQPGSSWEPFVCWIKMLFFLAWKELTKLKLRERRHSGGLTNRIVRLNIATGTYRKRQWWCVCAELLLPKLA